MTVMAYTALTDRFLLYPSVERLCILTIMTTISIGNHMYLHAIKNNCTSNSQIIARGEAECTFDCYKYNYSLIAHKYMRLPTNHIALPMTLYPYT